MVLIKGIKVLKKIIISILILCGAFFVFQREPFISKQIPVSHHPKTFMDEENYSSTKIKEDYDKGLEFIKNREISKEEKRKEKLALTIQYIRDLGFEVDEENNTVSSLILIEESIKINEYGHISEYQTLDYKDFIKLNQLSNVNFSLKVKNPIGQDFIINYKNIIKEDNRVSGEPSSVSLENGEEISKLSKLYYNKGAFKFKTYLDDNEYMPKDLEFEYDRKYDKKKGVYIKGITKLRVDLDQNTGEKIYVKFKLH